MTRILAFDPAGLGGDVGWAYADTVTHEIKYGATPELNFRISDNIYNYDVVISENYNQMFNNGDAFRIKKFNEMLSNKLGNRLELVQPQDRMNVPYSIVSKITKQMDTSHHKDATSALKHVLNYASKLDFNFNLWLCNEL